MSEIDRERLGRYVKMVGGTVAQGFNCAISAVGDRLGLYGTIAACDSVNSDELAELTGLSERWLREWLRHQAAVGHLDYDGITDRFSMCPEAALVLANPESPAFLGGGIDAVLAAIPAVPQVAEAFRTGVGMTYDDHGAGCACGIERLSAYTQKYQLVRDILPLVDGIVDRLSEGAVVADVGCGSAQSTLAMAKAFPNSQFIGYDISLHALERAQQNLADSGLNNVRIVNPENEPMSESGPFDLVTTFDVIHDAPFPDRLIADIRQVLKEDGTWLCEDIRSFASFEDNLREHPLAGLLYGFSVMVCMSSGLSAPGGAGLGTMGFHEDVAREMTRAAGFANFLRLDHDNPMNHYYAIRP